MKTKLSAGVIIKRTVVFALLITALSAAVYLNWQYSSKTGSVALRGSLSTTAAEKYLGDAKYVNATAKATAAEDDYFAAARIKRNDERKQSLSALNDVINNVKSTDEAKTSAGKSVETLTKLSRDESNIETLITAKGFENCVAVMTEKSVSVIVKCSKNGLLESETRQIQDIVTSNSDISLENIKIIEIK